MRRLAPCQSARNYFDDKSFYTEQISSFVKDGLLSGDKVLVAATGQHLKEIENQLRAEGVDLFALTVHDMYVPMDAEKLLDKFLVKWWPDAVLFRYLIATIAARMLKSEKNVRVYSELAALLWLKGHTAASAQLEIIWNRLVETQKDYPHVRVTSVVYPPADTQAQPYVASFLS